MKVQFVAKDESGNVTERGNIVEVLSTECGWFRVPDGCGDDMLIPPSCVEVVEPYPTPQETKPVKIGDSDEEWESYLRKEYGCA